MNIFVSIKQVPDTETKIKTSGDGIDTSGIKWIVSPYDEFAIEEALKLKEKNAGSKVTAITAGPARVVEALRTALAMGADEAIHVDVPESADNNLCAKALAGAVKAQGQVDIIFTGKEAIDDGSAQVSQLLGEYLGFSIATVVLSAEYSATALKCKREVEGGALEHLEVPYPAIIAAQKGMNQPRFASLPNIMKAKKKEIKTLKMSEVGASENDQKIKYRNLTAPPAKQAGKTISGDAAAQAKELVKLLHEEAKVI